MFDSILEKILLALTRKENRADYCVESVVARENSPLNLLENEYPWFGDFLRGKQVLDFGCGEGRQSIAMAKNLNCRVTGVDINAAILDSARSFAADSGLTPTCLKFSNSMSEIPGKFDVVISQNSMEHFPDPEAVIKEMVEKINPRSCIFITFGPPWFAPFGSHMHFFCKIPWLNIIFPERVVMKVRSRYRDDGAMKYEEVESGLNKMTLRKFFRLLSEAKLFVIYSKFTCVKGVNFLGRIPLVRELFVNRVSVVVSPIKGQIIHGKFVEYPFNGE